MKKRELVAYDLGPDQPTPVALGESRLLWNMARQKSYLANEKPLFTPTMIRKAHTGDYFVISETPDSDATVWALDQELGFLGATGLNNVRTEGGDIAKIAAIYDFAPIDATSVLAFGDVQLKDRSWRTGFLKVTSGLTYSFTGVEYFDPRSSFKEYYLTGRNMICSGEGIAHALVRYESPRVLSIRSGEPEPTVTSLEGILPYDDLPELPKRGADYKAKFAGTASVDGPESIYCWDGEIYLLIREGVLDTSRYIWKLARLDLENRQIDAVWRLPTTEPDVFLAPGAEFLAVISKGKPKDDPVKDDSRRFQIPLQPIEFVDIIALSEFDSSPGQSIANAHEVCSNH